MVHIHTLFHTYEENPSKSSLPDVYNYIFFHRVVPPTDVKSTSLLRPFRDYKTVLLTKTCCCCCCCCCFRSAGNTPDDRHGWRARHPVFPRSIVASRLSWTRPWQDPSRADVSSRTSAHRFTGSSTYLLRARVVGWYCAVDSGRVGVWIRHLRTTIESELVRERQ